MLSPFVPHAAHALWQALGHAERDRRRALARGGCGRAGAGHGRDRRAGQRQTARTRAGAGGRGRSASRARRRSRIPASRSSSPASRCGNSSTCPASSSTWWSDDPPHPAVRRRRAGRGLRIPPARLDAAAGRARKAVSRRARTGTRRSMPRSHQQLRAAGVTLAANPAEASAVIRLHLDETGRELLSVSAQNRPGEYEVYYRAEFSVTRRRAGAAGARSRSR